MNDKTLVERLRMTGKRISVPCPDGIDGCLVHHFRIETDPLCEEAATRIEALEAALRKIAGGAKTGEEMFKERLGDRKSPTWFAVNVLQDSLAACRGTAERALEGSGND